MASTVTIQEGIRQTFKAAANVTAAAATTDIFTITGAATRVIRVIRLKVSGIATAATITSIDIIRRTTANTGGTAVAVGMVCTDSGNNNLAKALVQTYTANPTIGSTTNGGALEIVRAQFSTAGAAVAAQIVEFDFTLPGSILPTLRTQNDVLALNLEAATLAGLALSVSIEWTEEET